MKSILITLFFLGIFHCMHSQDTIKFVNNTIQVVKVYEVGINEIKYHRFDNIDGPIYVSSKSDIESISYYNGHVETFNDVKTNPVVTKKIAKGNPIPSNEKIIILDPKLMYAGKPLGESRLLRLINNVPDQQKKIILMKEYTEMKSYKKKQYLFGFVGLGVGLVLPYIGIISGLILDDPTPLIIGVAGGLTIGVTGAVISGINKKKRLKKKIETATLYNNLIS